MASLNVEVMIRFRWWFYPVFVLMRLWCWLRLPMSGSTVDRLTRRGTRLFLGEREITK